MEIPHFRALRFWGAAYERVTLVCTYFSSDNLLTADIESLALFIQPTVHKLSVQ